MYIYTDNFYFEIGSLTLQFQASSVQIGFLRQSNDSASVSEIFRKLQHSLGREDYMKLFPIVLTDNGSEFTDPETIEIAENGEILSTESSLRT